jgi:hypothetical protein
MAACDQAFQTLLEVGSGYGIETAVKDENDALFG